MSNCFMQSLQMYMHTFLYLYVKAYLERQEIWIHLLNWTVSNVWTTSQEAPIIKGSVKSVAETCELPHTLFSNTE